MAEDARRLEKFDGLASSSDHEAGDGRFGRLTGGDPRVIVDAAHT